MGFKARATTGQGGKQLVGSLDLANLSSVDDGDNPLGVWDKGIGSLEKARLRELLNQGLIRFSLLYQHLESIGANPWSDIRYGHKFGICHVEYNGVMYRSKGHLIYEKKKEK